MRQTLFFLPKNLPQNGLSKTRVSHFTQAERSTFLLHDHNGTENDLRSVVSRREEAQRSGQNAERYQTRSTRTALATPRVPDPGMKQDTHLPAQLRALRTVFVLTVLAVDCVLCGGIRGFEN